VFHIEHFIDFDEKWVTLQTRKTQKSFFAFEDIENASDSI